MITIKDAAGVNRDVATELIGGNHYQVVKSGWGAGGVILETSKANPMPVQGMEVIETVGTMDAVNEEVVAVVPDGAQTVTVSLRDPTTWANGTTLIAFEGSDDGGLTFQSLPITRRNDSSAVKQVGVFASNNDWTFGLKNFVAGGANLNRVRVRMTARTGADSITVAIRIGDADPGLPLINTPVIGSITAGSPPSGGPVYVGGTDGTNLRAFRTDSFGRQLTALQRPWTNTGDYRAVTAALAHAAAADAATGGRWWLINPVGSGIAIAVLRVMFFHAFTAAAAQLTAPRITLERCTFTGTASGAAITPSKRVRTATQGQALDAAAVGSLRTASTGLTLTAGEVEHAVLPPTALTATSGTCDNSYSLYGVSERGEDALILAPGEGLVCRQADASATGRSWLNTIDWSEFTT